MTKQYKFPQTRLKVVFEQSRSANGVAQCIADIPTASFDMMVHDACLKYVLDRMRKATIGAHGVDVMPHQDDWYWFDPWPPARDIFSDINGDLIFRTVLKYGDGVTNLRSYAAETLKHAQARGVEIKVPIRPQEPFIDRFIRDVRLASATLDPETVKLLLGE